MIKFINCNECGQHKPHYAYGLCHKCYMKLRSNKKFGIRKYRIKLGHIYHAIYKPHYEYSNSMGYVYEHRYIMYIYLSILNNKVTYIEGFDVHHVNENPLDNRIDNLQLLTRLEHNKLEKTKDKLDWFCNLCKCKTTRKRLKDGKYYYQWHNDIEGHLCRDCYLMVRYYRKKLGLTAVISYY